MIAFVCRHVAKGEPIWYMERAHASEGVPEESMQALCEDCQKSPVELTADDCFVIHNGHLRSQLIALAESPL